MAYRATKARKAFEGEIKEIVRRLRIAQKAGTPVELREYAIAAAIFLAHAELENYVSDVMASLAQLWTVVAQKGSQLPRALRSHLFLLRANLEVLLANRISGGSEHNLLEQIATALDGSAGNLADDARPLGVIGATEIVTDYGYPSKKNLERLLRRLGVGDPKGQLNAAVQQNVILLLQSFGALRTGLAHSASLPGISIPDVVNRLSDAKTVVRAIDRLLFKQARITCSELQWRSEMC